MSQTTTTNAPNQRASTGITNNPGPFLAEVMQNQDPLYSGRLQVYIPDFGGEPTSPASWISVSYMSPYYGIQPLANRLEPNRAGAGGPIESYGMWMQPPDLGVKVLVVFVNGDRSRGYWIGCIPEIGSHAAVPGQDKGDFDVFAPGNYAAARQDIKSLEGQRPEHSTKPTFENQGLNDDKLRGPITSSSFRESPSRVFGFNTPGAHSFVMDDGDQEGNSKLVRIRTAAGNQIMMNDDAGLIYIINAQGTGWIEISPSGQIDVYGAAGINLATPGDVNIHADKDVNINAGNSIKMVAAKGAKLQGSEECQLHGKKLFLQGVDSIEMHSCKEIKINSFKDIFMKSCENTIIHAKCLRFNSGTVKEAEQVPPEKPKDVSGYQTVVARAPNKEPYKEHDNGSGGGGGGGGAGGGGAGGLGLPGIAGNLGNLASGVDLQTAAAVLGSGNGISIDQAANLKFDDPSKPLAIFAGGIGSAAFNTMSPMAAAMRAQGTHNVLLINTLGGYSDAQLSALANNISAQGIIVDGFIGHSVGAVAAVNFSNIFKGRINNMALIDSGSPTDLRMVGGKYGVKDNVGNLLITQPSSGATSFAYGSQLDPNNKTTNVTRLTRGQNHVGAAAASQNDVLGMVSGGRTGSGTTAARSANIPRTSQTQQSNNIPTPTPRPIDNGSVTRAPAGAIPVPTPRPDTLPPGPLLAIDDGPLTRAPVGTIPLPTPRPSSNLARNAIPVQTTTLLSPVTSTPVIAPRQEIPISALTQDYRQAPFIPNVHSNFDPNTGRGIPGSFDTGINQVPTSLAGSLEARPSLRPGANQIPTGFEGSPEARPSLRPGANQVPTGFEGSPELAGQVPQSPAAAAGESLPGLSGSEPATAIPAQQGGGDTGSFEKGNNCEKPANCGTGGGQSGPGQGSGVPDNLDTTLGQSPEDLQKTYDQLRDQGLTHEQAIGAMANIQRESGFKPGAIGDNGNSFGLYQFNRPGGRGDPFLAAVPDWQTNAAGQHRYMFTQDSLGKAYASRSFSSSLEAANNFTNTVEIPLNRASYTAPGGFNSRIVPKLEASIIRRP